MIVKNNRFLIKTTEGYKRFVGIAESNHDCSFVISFSNGSEVKCSAKHKFWNQDGSIITTKDLITGMKLQAENQTIEVVSINQVFENTVMFDIMEVDTLDNNFILSNSIKTHNCQFLTSEKSLINSDVLDFYQTPEIIEEINGFNVFKEKIEHSDALLIITIDPSGGGDDASCIQLWCIEVDKVYEMASFVDSDADASVLFEKILWLQQYMRERWQYQPDESLIIFERNGVGEGLAQILTQTEKAIEELEIPIYFDSKGKAGLHMTPNLKSKMALQFKNLVEYDKMKINDVQFIEELYGYVRTAGGNYSAKSGYHDDRCSAALLMVFYLLNEFANFAFGEFSVDTVMIVNKENKLVPDKMDEVDPAIAYRNRKMQEEEDAKLIAEAKRLEEEAKKKAELQYWSDIANRPMSAVISDDDSDDYDYDEFDVLPTLM